MRRLFRRATKCAKLGDLLERLPLNDQKRMRLHCRGAEYARLSDFMEYSLGDD
jgi:hypothetical protein